MSALAQQAPAPVVFLLGPSGVGKSTLGAWVREDLRFLHLEIDRWDGAHGDGIDLEGLRTEWNTFCHGGEASPLAAAIRERIVAACRRGAVLTFASPLVLSPAQIALLARFGISVLVLYGSGAECLQAFLEREGTSGRGLPLEHWMFHNAASHAKFSLSEYAPYRIMAFHDGRFRTREALVDEVRKRAGER